MRDLINLVENAQNGLESITSEQVIGYARDPVNVDVHKVYEEQIDFAFDGDRDALDRWITDMIGDVKSKISQMVRTHRLMYRGFTGPVKNPLGVHWTVSPDVAQSFAAGGEVLEAYIVADTVDWLGTVVRGIFWDNDNEDELYLIRGSEIKLVDGRVGHA